LPAGPPSWYPSIDFFTPGRLVADRNKDGAISINEAFIYSCCVDEVNPTLPFYDESHPSGMANPYWNKNRGTSQPYIWSALDDGYNDAIDPDDTYLN